MTTSAARAVLATLAVAVAGGLVAAPATAARASGGTTVTVSDPLSADGPDRLLRRPAHGAAAVARLGDDLDEAAAVNDVEPDELETMLLDDTTLWVHPTGLLYYVDPVPTGVGAAEPSLQAARAPYPYDQTFSLHSKPGSSRTIYLDFTGENVSGTAWNLERGYLLPARTHPAYDLDGTPSTFNNAERDAIQSIWQRVSEDYAPFDVDVTTADPGLDALRRTTPSDTVYGTRALITPSVAAANHLCDGGCGGLAFMGTYDVAGSDLGVTGSDYMQPAWVFPHLLSNNTKAIAEAVSHEVGHNLNLDHDGSPAGGYYGGQGAWAPIMGGSYDRPISQWSKGEYAGANNLEDDLAIITQNGLSYQPDDHGNTIGAATPVTAGTAAGLITTRNDQDVLAFPMDCSGNVTFSASPAPTSPNLDIGLRVLAANGSQLASADPVSAATTGDVASGMDAATGVPVTAGSTVYVVVDGVGAGSTATNGYSDYASIGRYTVSSSACSDAPTSRPDLLISTRERTGYLGDDLYNASGSGQSAQQSAGRGQLRSFFVQVTNDGTTTSTFAVSATRAPKGATVTYWNNGNDITAFLTAGGGEVSLAPDQFAPIRVDIRLTRRAVIGTKKSALLTAASSGPAAGTDVVKATVKVVRR